MGPVHASITVSLDGYFAGPGDGPGCGLGVGGERLHHWVFGGPWQYSDASRGAPRPDDAAWLAAAMAENGAVVTGRNTYEAAGRWGGTNPWPVPCVVVTHRPQEIGPGHGFVVATDLRDALDTAHELAGHKQVHVMGGGDLIRQALAAGSVDELTLIVAPCLLGGGKRLFADGDGVPGRVLEQLGVRQSDLATFLHYRVGDPVGELA
jgi:dihydrofolate reductase